MSKHLFPYDWRIQDGYPAKGIKKHGCKVFGTFICGGGSSMGYKLAGFEHIGGVEIDERIAEIYEKNHHPKYLFNEDIRAFNSRKELPEDLYNLDILDGSPPCSTFSLSGSREKAWGKEKRFAEGQKMQTLDDLVFVYADTILKLKPKVFILENVKGLAIGNGVAYLKTVVNKLSCEYRCQVFVLNAATMGVPQARERCFVIGLRNDLSHLPKLSLYFNEEPIKFGCVRDDNSEYKVRTGKYAKIFNMRKANEKSISDTNKRIYGKVTGFNCVYIIDNSVSATIPATDVEYVQGSNGCVRALSRNELLSISSFPKDYDANLTKLHFLCGMSVPPVMIAQISYQIYLQWLSRLNENK